MRIAKIRNRYMYESEKPNGWHWYLIFFNRKKRRYEAAQMTHLYEIPRKKLGKIRSGYIKEERIKGFKMPSGIRNDIYEKNAVDGGSINLKDKDVIYLSKRHIDPKQSKRIKLFLKKRNPRVCSPRG